MVLDNDFRQLQKNDGNENQNELFGQDSFLHSLAHPLDRLAASIVDISAVLLPLVLFLSAPIKRILVSSLLLQDHQSFLISALSILTLTFVVIVFYQALFIYFFGTTIGKKIFHIRVVNVWGGGRVEFSDALKRSVIWFFETICLMIPHVSVFSDPKRRPIHDRISNTVVISEKKENVMAPGFVELTLAKTFNSFTFAILAIVGIKISILIWQSLPENEVISLFAGSSHQVCEDVEWASESWPKVEREAFDGRIQVALGLFAAGEVPKTCLETEVNSFLSIEESESPVAYLAQAFIHSSNSELSNRYLKRICQLNENSSSCKMAQIVESWSDSDWTNVDNLFSEFSKGAPSHIAIWAIRHYVKQRDFFRARLYLDQLSPQRALASFTSLHRIKVLYGAENWEALDAVANTAFETLPIDERLIVSHWLCQRTYRASGCKGLQEASCDIFNQDATAPETLLLNPEVATLKLLSMSCHDKESEFELSYMGALSSGTAKLARALSLRKDQEKSLSQKLLIEVMESKEASSDERMTAEAEYLRLATLEEIKKRYAIWEKQKGDDDWSYLGSQFMTAFNREKSYTLTMEIGARLIKEKYSQDWVVKPLVVAQYFSGKRSRAWNLAQKIHTQPLARMETRQPASAKEKTLSSYDKVYFNLLKDFGGRN